MALKSNAKFEEKLICCFTNNNNFGNFDPSTRKSHDIYFWVKVCNVWPKKVQRIYLSWHWRVIQNSKKNWLLDLANFHQNTRRSQNWDSDGILLSKVEHEFDEFWPRYSKFSNICTLMGSFWPKNMLF